MPPVLEGDPAPGGGGVASIILHATVPVHGSVTLPVFMSWNFPKKENPWRDGDESLPAILDTYAGAHFADAWAVANYTGESLPRLRAGTDHVAGLSYILDSSHVRSTVESIFRYNFRASMEWEHNVQRVYGLGDEAGLLLCSCPGGNRPALPFVYSDEIWTGIEYQVAAHLVFEGLVDEGLTLVKAASERYSGDNRNPWNQIECGFHYARAMASWSVKLALDGFRYSVPTGMLGFAPKINNESYKTFWSTGTGWGTYSQ